MVWGAHCVDWFTRNSLSKTRTEGFLLQIPSGGVFNKKISFVFNLKNSSVPPDHHIRCIVEGKEIRRFLRPTTIHFAPSTTLDLHKEKSWESHDLQSRMRSRVDANMTSGVQKGWWRNNNNFLSKCFNTSTSVCSWTSHWLSFASAPLWDCEHLCDTIEDTLGHAAGGIC